MIQVKINKLVNLSELNSENLEEVDQELENLTEESKKREEKYIDNNPDIEKKINLPNENKEIDKEYYDEKVESKNT
jgi:hypothetical protein